MSGRGMRHDDRGRGEILRVAMRAWMEMRGNKPRCRDFCRAEGARQQVMIFYASCKMMLDFYHLF